MQRIPLAIWLIAVVIYAQLTSFVGMLGGYADKRFAIVFSVCIFTLVWVNRVRQPKGLVATGWLLFTGAAILSEWNSELTTSFSWLEVVLFPLTLLAVAGLARCFASIPKSRTDGVTILLAGMMSYALMTPAMYLFALLDGVPDLSQYIPWGFVNIRYWNHLASWLLPLLPLAVLIGPFRNNNIWRVGVVITAGIWWWVLLMTAGRGSLLGIGIGVVLVLFICRKFALDWLKVLSIQLMVGVGFWLVLSVVLPDIFVEDPRYRTLGNESSIDIRILQWKEAWRMSLHSFPLGMGGQSWITHAPILEAYQQSNKLAHPHNMYMMWAAEYGWAAIAGLALILAGAVRRLVETVRVLRHERAPLERWATLSALIASVVAGFIHAGASAVFMAPASMLIALPVLGLFWSILIPPKAWVREHKRLGSTAATPRWMRIFLSGLLLVGLVVWVSGVINYYEAMRSDQPVYGEQVHEKILPRFWFHGYFPRPSDTSPTNE